LQRDPKSLLWDAQEAAEVIAAVTAGKSFADFAIGRNNRKCCR
jgi:hypothetical protein